MVNKGEEIDIHLSDIGVVLLPDIWVAKEGFWITDKFEYTTKGDAYYWVAPSCVLGVTKLADESAKES